MKPISIFLASSEELNDDRIAFKTLIYKLNKVFESRDIVLKLYEREELTETYSAHRKQDDYLEKIRDCDIFIALIHTKIGASLLEELDLAKDYSRKNNSPKIYIYNKKSATKVTPLLTSLKEKLLYEDGCYIPTYSAFDLLALNFVLQLQLVDTTIQESLKVEDGNIMFDGLQVAKMENLSFVALNEDFQKMHQRLAELPEKIDKKRLRVDKYPDDEELKDELQELLKEYNDKKERFAEYQNNLFSTAKRIAQLQNEQITDRMRRAMDAFYEGDVRRGNTILEEATIAIEIDLLKKYAQSKELLEQKKDIVNIKDTLSKIPIILNDSSSDIKERVSSVDKLYSQVIEMTIEVDYDKNEYDNILCQYIEFVNTYTNDLNKILEICENDIRRREEVYGTEHYLTARAYNNIGLIYYYNGETKKALEYYFKALEIQEITLGEEHSDTAKTYNNIARVYYSFGDYFKAEEYYIKAIEIREREFGESNFETSSSYNDVGELYYRMSRYGDALKYYFKSLKFRDDKEDAYKITTYTNIASVYYQKGVYCKSLEYNQKVYGLSNKLFGYGSIKTAKACEYLANAYYKCEKYEDAKKRYLEAIDIVEHIQEKDYNILIRLYTALGFLHKENDKNKEALDCFSKAIEYCDNENIDSSNFIPAYNNIGGVYSAQGYYDKALECYFNALKIQERILGREHPSTANIYSNIGCVYSNKGEYDKALEYFFKALEIQERILGREHPSTANFYSNIGDVYSAQGYYDKALEYYFNALKIQERILGSKHPDTVNSYSNIGGVYSAQGDYDKAIEYYEKELQNIEPDTPFAVSCKKNLSILFNKKGEEEYAKQYYKESENSLDPSRRVFISASIGDSNLVYKYARAISNSGFVPVISIDKPDLKIEDCAIFLSLLTEKFHRTSQCREDWEVALNLEKKIVGLQIEDFKVSRIWDNSLEKWYECEDSDKFDFINREMNKLLSRLSGNNSLSDDQIIKNEVAFIDSYEPIKNDTKIFLSYKRKDGVLYARIVELALKLQGYSENEVFMDYESIKDGYFNHKILDSIYSCEDYILVVTNEVSNVIAEEQKNPNDWVIKEYENAKKYKKHIIPLIVDDCFSGWPEKETLTEKGKNLLRVITTEQESRLKVDSYLKHSISDLKNRLSYQKERSAEDEVVYKVKVNKPANLYIDDIKYLLDADSFTKVELKKSEYYRRIEDVEDKSNFKEDIIDLSSKDKAEIITL